MQNMRRGVFIFLVYIIFILLALEIGLRILMPAPDFLGISVNGFGADHILSPNPRLIYVPKPNGGEFNAAGYRGPVFPFERNLNIARVVLMGDSVTEGVLVDENKRFSALLNADSKGKVEFVNLGVRGYNPVQELEYLKEKGVLYQPDYVIVGITGNDLIFGSNALREFSRKISAMKEKPYLQDYYRLKSSMLATLFRSQLFRTLYGLCVANKKPGSETDFYDAIKYRLEKSDVEQVLAELQQLSAKYNFKLAFIFYPLDREFATKIEDSSAYEVIKPLVAQAGIAFLDLDAEVMQKNDKAYLRSLLIDHDHLTVEGHRYVADRLEQSLPQLFPGYP